MNRFINKLGTLRITEKSGKYMAQIAVSAVPIQTTGTDTMGIDLGLKIPAVAVTEKGKTIFCGNGRQNKYTKRKHRSLRKKLGKLKKVVALKKLNNREQRWMQVYFLVLVHAIILIVGGHYTYVEMPIFNWLRDTFHLDRNYCDRLGHFAQGFIPAIIAREILLRKSGLNRGKLLSFITISI